MSNNNYEDGNTNPSHGNGNNIQFKNAPPMSLYGSTSGNMQGMPSTSNTTHFSSLPPNGPVPKIPNPTNASPFVPTSLFPPIFFPNAQHIGNAPAAGNLTSTGFPWPFLQVPTSSSFISPRLPLSKPQVIKFGKQCVNNSLPLAVNSVSSSSSINPNVPIVPNVSGPTTYPVSLFPASPLKAQVDFNSIPPQQVLPLPPSHWQQYIQLGKKNGLPEKTEPPGSLSINSHNPGIPKPSTAAHLHLPEQGPKVKKEGDDEDVSSNVKRQRKPSEKSSEAKKQLLEGFLLSTFGNSPEQSSRAGKKVTFAYMPNNTTHMSTTTTKTSHRGAKPIPSTSVSATNYKKTHSHPTVTAKIPTAPNWHRNWQDSATSLDAFKLYSVTQETAEYKVIADLLQPFQVTKIEQIVNPDLWKRFVNTRIEMLRSKTDDLNILAKLGLDEQEVMRCAHLSMNYDRDPLLVPYSDNMVLLFHCTRNEANVRNILSQGLDERLSSAFGGLLGKGIYFSDNPQKCRQYDGVGGIFIFAVLLGDCISVNHFLQKNNLVREPEKTPRQKRHFNDLFFDSIVANLVGYNEYVIYNRYQCYPLYLATFDRSVTANFNKPHVTSTLPPIAWVPSVGYDAMPIQNKTFNWPFFAANLFADMGATRPVDDEKVNEKPSISVDEKVAILMNLGFNDAEKNKEILLKFNNDIEQAVNYFLDNEGATSTLTISFEPSTSTAIPTTSVPESVQITSEIHMPSTSKDVYRDVVVPEKVPSTSNIPLRSNVIVVDDSDDSDDDPERIRGEGDSGLPEDIVDYVIQYDPEEFRTKMEDCPICCNVFESFESSPSSWEQLQCSHKLCLACYATILTSRSTMSGIQHTFVKCPFCLGVSGTEVGTCPDMEMNVTIQSISCASYEPLSTIVINYVGQSHHFNRTAYLPNNSEGQDVLRLLRIAFDRRLCFTVGTSATTGQDNTIVWNIHHKTAAVGGVPNYGYPDAGYLDRLKWELKAFGIK